MDHRSKRKKEKGEKSKKESQRRSLKKQNESRKPCQNSFLAMQDPFKGAGLDFGLEE